MPMYAQIVLGIPLKNTFDYAVPEHLEKELEIGKRVYVPFRNKNLVGYCVGKSKKSRSVYTKEIISVLDEEIIFTENFLNFLKKLSEKYFASWGEMMELATPVYLRKPRKTFLLKEGIYERKDLDLNLSPIVKEIVSMIEEKRKDKFLIFEDYVQNKRFNLYYDLCKWVLNKDKHILIITPEIQEAEELASFLKEKNLPWEIFLYHSGLREKEAFLNWIRIREKRPKIIIGTRMAVFHPQENIGLIIVDDEGSPFHKQDEFPFYNTRDISLFRASFFKIPLIFAGNPPSVDSYFKVEKGLFQLIDLREKPKTLPDVSIVDLTLGKRKNYITKSLELKITEVLDKKGKIFLFYNRRGFATFIRCRKCGKVIRCRRCERNLTYHFSIKKLVCHYCGDTSEPPSLCPECQTAYLRYRGLGTEKLESELIYLFPKAKISRIDLDVKKEKIMGDLKNIDIWVGTSLLLKLPPLSNLSLVGIINLEQGINFPDFRANERLFSLLINFLKLIKKEDGWGNFLIQTHNPENSLLFAFKNLDYEMFYQEELNLKKELGLPPFRNIVIVNLRGKKRKSVEENAHLLVKRLKENNSSRGIFISEAVPHPIFKLRDKYRWQIFIKSANIKKISLLLEKVLSGKRKFRGSILTVDVEPSYRE